MRGCGVRMSGVAVRWALSPHGSRLFDCASSVASSVPATVQPASCCIFKLFFIQNKVARHSFARLNAKGTGGAVFISPGHGSW